MDKLTTTIQQILAKNKVEAPFPEGAHLIPDLLNAVKAYTEYVIGEDVDHNPRIQGSAHALGCRNCRLNKLRKEQTKRAKEKL